MDDPLPAQGAVRLGTTRYRHGSRIESMAVSADGRLAAVASGWRSFSPAQVFDLTDGRCLYSLPQEYQRGIEAVGLSPDGKTLATRDDKFLYFWDAATGKELRKVKYVPGGDGSRSPTDWLTFAPDGKQIATAMMGTAVHLIDVETGMVQWTIEAARFPRVFSRRQAAGDRRVRQEKGSTTPGYGGRTGKNWEFPAGSFHPPSRSLSRPMGRRSPAAVGVTLGSLWRRHRQGADGFRIGRTSECRLCTRWQNGRPGRGNIYLYDPATGKERLRVERRARGLAFSRD
jgi:hypothetical protein